MICQVNENAFSFLVDNMLTEIRSKPVFRTTNTENKYVRKRKAYTSFRRRFLGSGKTTLSIVSYQRIMVKELPS